MDLYHLTLFVHIAALLVASGATAIMKLAIGRRARARTVGEVLDWHNVMMATSKAFPICLAVFVLTGGFMLSRTQIAVWSTGFVVAGLFGVAWLLVSGVLLGTKGKALTGMLEGMIAAKGADAPAPQLVPPPLMAALPIINTFVALSVAFDMVTKPQGIPTALGIVGIGIVLGAVMGLRAAPAPQRVPAA